jgi:hypothetical protein
VLDWAAVSSEVLAEGRSAYSCGCWQDSVSCCIKGLIFSSTLSIPCHVGLPTGKLKTRGSKLSYAKNFENMK